MNWLIIWTVLVLLMALLGWLACTYFWRYYAFFKHLVWGCLVLLVGFLSYDYGVDRGTWVVRDAYHEAGDIGTDNPSTTQNAKIPFLYDTIVAGFLMYCILMLLIGGQIVNNSARKTAPKIGERQSLFDPDGRTLNR